ncbi:octanoyltransferase [Paenibacillus swuensis]|uniref:Octanoyltransferase n=1 Tax=Paenibacillus swuensis TaxID=1178515 RepID=A0A172TMA2_9BACL|nr:lipoyl(octanoyl) transferase LipB [Paenibacillus swuensis]ANE48044.1 octanoyltransferase [Paenibacillus swuensis]
MMKPLQAYYHPRIEYNTAWDLQKDYVKAIDKEEEAETLLLLEHPPTFTIGADRNPEHLLWDEEELKERGISVFQIDRGGDITYHGPGQLVGYPLVYLDAVGLNLHGYLRNLEQVIINYLREFGIEGSRKPEYTGVWVGDRKICAIGVKFNKCRSRRGFVTSHGFAFNIHAGVDGFEGIIPCGIREFGVTSLEECTGKRLTLREAAEGILPYFCQEFGYDKDIMLSDPV